MRKHCFVALATVLILSSVSAWAQSESCTANAGTWVGTIPASDTVSFTIDCNQTTGTFTSIGCSTLGGVWPWPATVTPIVDNSFTVTATNPSPGPSCSCWCVPSIQWTFNTSNSCASATATYLAGGATGSLTVSHNPQSGIKVLINGTPDTATFTMHPSVTSSTLSPYGTGPENELIQLSCVDGCNKGIAGCFLDFGISTVPGSGGHVHNDARPVGTIKSDQCQLGLTDFEYQCTGDDSGNALLLYTAPEASGITTAQGTASTNGDSRDFSFTINIQIDGLALASGNDLIVDTVSHNHGNNNGWASPGTNAALNSMAAKFAQNLFMLGPYPVPAIEIDAISLPLGGLFDYSVPWSPPHVSHRFGNNADVCMKAGVDCSHGFTPQQRKALAWAAWFAGFSTPVLAESPGSITANHWHLVGPY